MVNSRKRMQPCSSEWSSPGEIGPCFKNLDSNLWSRLDSHLVYKILSFNDLDSNLWSRLDSHLAYKILSYLPVDILMDTLEAVNPNWKSFMLSGHMSSYVLSKFGHGENIASSFGFIVLQYSTVLWESKTLTSLMALEHETLQWRSFSNKLPLLQLKVNPETDLRFRPGNHGLILCNFKTVRSLTHANQQFGIGLPGIGVWNPVLNSFRWLPSDPSLHWSTLNNFVQDIPCSIMVDEVSRSYKVLATYRENIVTGTRWSYSVYHSISKTWTRPQLLPDFGIVGSGHATACGRYAFFEGSGSGLQGSDYSSRNGWLGLASTSEIFLCWYDSYEDSWHRRFLSKILTDIGYTAVSHPGNTSSATIDGLAILEGKLYVTIQRDCKELSSTNEGQFVVASLDLKVLGSEGGGAISAAFDFETGVPNFLTGDPQIRDQAPRLSLFNVFTCSLNMYSYTLKGKGYLAVRGHSLVDFAHFDVSSRLWLNVKTELANGSTAARRGTVSKFYQFKPSLVVA